MRSKWLMLIIAAVALVGLSGCATVIKPTPAQDLNPKVRSGALVQKTNNFEMILDTSASMDEGYEFFVFTQKSEASETRTGVAGTGTRPAPEKLKATKLEYEQHLARLFNDTIPNLKLTAGLRDFAGQRWLSRNYDTKLWYGIAPWVKADLEKSIYAVNTAGVESPLDKALDAATMDLKPLAGKSAVIIFTDGLDMPKAVASAQVMKAAMKDNICIYAVRIGADRMTLDNPQGEGKALLEKVVKAGECGAYVEGRDVESPAGMAAFVEKVFLGPPPPPPAAEAPVVVPPVTPAPAAPEKLESIYFDFDKYVIKPEFRDPLKRNAEWLQKNPEKKVVIEGNCDERGTNEYNMALGQRRADAAAKYLMDLGIAKDRVSTVSYGEEKPICTEHNEACWSKNRRNDFIVK
jgi:OOP family OmpA-OmpF porin